MTPKRWQEIEDILDQVMPRPPEERTAQLDRLCGEDATLRGQVEEMLIYCDQAQEEAFLEKSPLADAQNLVLGSILAEEPETGLKAGDSVGSYQIVFRVGHGGMGEVYRAERADGRFHKDVALKVVKRGMDTREILQRFRYEREILARLEHPNIAQLHDAGVTDDGRPYFVMEYVEKGQPLDVYCDGNHLSVRARLELFKTVCEAVRYAHRNLVVHRDLKPGNILVRKDETGRPQVKLLDFGIAKLLDDDPTLHTVPVTEMASRRLTPSYAAPEQVRGDPTTPATDVYALGVILYKLLTGRRPYHFEDRSMATLEQVICHTVPEKPSAVVLRPIANGEAAQPTPETLSEQRATSPRMLSRQLKGDLEAMILMALRKEPERRYASAARLLDDIERYLDNRPVEAQPDSVAYRATKFVQRHKVGMVVGIFAFFGLVGLGATAWQANEAAQQAQRETERADVTLGVISNMLLTVNPESGQGATFSARDLIDAGLSEIDALENQPRAQAKMMNQMGRVTLQVGLVDLADSLHRQALDIQRRKLGPEDLDVAESLLRLAQVYAAQRKPEEAEATFKRAMAVNPDNAVVYATLGVFYHAQQRYEEAAALLEKVIQLIPDDERGYISLGNIYLDLERRAEARQMYERAIALNPLHFLAHSNLAVLYDYEGRYADAARMFDKALEINHRSYELWGYLAAAHYWTPGGRDKALPAYQRAIEMGEEMLHEVNPDDAYVLSRLATYHAMIGEHDKARLRIERALDLAPQDVWVLFRASDTYEQLGERAVALRWIEQALAHGLPRTEVERDPAFRGLRSDPRYQQILQDSSDAQ